MDLAKNSTLSRALSTRTTSSFKSSFMGAMKSLQPDKYMPFVDVGNFIRSGRSEGKFGNLPETSLASKA